MSIDFGFTSAAFRTCLARKVHVELADSKVQCCSTTQPWLVLISNAALTSLQWYINVYHKSYIVLLNYCMTVKKRREMGAHLRQILYCINRNQIESPPGIVFNHSSPGWKHVCDYVFILWRVSRTNPLKTNWFQNKIYPWGLAYSSIL